MDKKIAHLGFIQSIITRMSTNSFLLKGWSVTIVAAIFALSAKDSDKNFLFLAYFPVLMFWSLDSFFLRLEKLYRNLYEQVALNNISSEKFTLDVHNLDLGAASIVDCVFSKTLAPFYGLLSFLVILTRVI